MASCADEIDAELAYGSPVRSKKVLKRQNFWRKSERKEGSRKGCRTIFDTCVVILILSTILVSALLVFQSFKTQKLVSNIQVYINILEQQLNVWNNSTIETENNLMERAIQSQDNGKSVEKNKKAMMLSTEEIIIDREHHAGSISKTYLNDEIQINSTFGINAANVLLHASIDHELSSEEVSFEDGFIANSFLGSDFGGYVLLDRIELPPNKAWCTNELQPVLTINLASYTNLTAVSYQHTRWNGSVPDGSPKSYDVMSCLDENCRKMERIMSNCVYKNSEDKQEQVCVIPTSLRLSPTKKVQFRIRENHGNTRKTCVYLVRVYGHIEEKLLTGNQKMKRDHINTCLSITNRYHNYRILFDIFDGYCISLFSKGCCKQCPECCTQCRINPSFSAVVYGIILVLITPLVMISPFFIILFLAKMYIRFF
ncbi:hypothetical protein GCK72_014713 [Caenorhabditis remanei]|uniref:SUN domain-containing protein n=1 Tax=Caenorhabditis remanei TaxID=31234 RepID=A0A6A5GUU5_CAERE|nr:hypothetical protein GCK72_014713 [Caenorhabditis remanei]KAF1758255.1 hypothetical protein GCK72_014713 [Caenorhabditis remanei]